MKVFISWSGNKSHQVGLVFREWLPSVIQSVEPYVSSEDIDKGARWSTDIAKELEDSSFGILCVTKENLEAPWLSFEAGALSTTMDKTFVSPFLFDIKRSEVDGPILQFQSTIFEKEDIKKLVVTLNKACKETGIPEARLDKAFEVWYPTLEEELNKLKYETEEHRESPEESLEENVSKIIEEILELSRDNQKLLKSPNPWIGEGIDEIKQKIDTALSYLQRGVDGDRLVSRYKMAYLDEMVHVILPNFQREYKFLIALNLLTEEIPWIYNMGQELINMMRSDASLESKKQSLNDFKNIFSFTFEHPVMRNPRVARSRMINREVPFIVMEVLKELDMELDMNSKDEHLERSIIPPIPALK